MNKPTHGGAREGAGRKTIEKKFQKKRTLTLSDQWMDKAKLIGNGNASEGIRIALDVFVVDTFNLDVKRIHNTGSVHTYNRIED